ncbi:hypothetical protein AMTR_s00238p00020510 [Amborella trichopoda]|uniref:Uncharacterized protein n=1 Tax=Amborella trichopoda TaxID=13333 RepID=W1NTW1_AMBTC|nr:hypothetical protein AMTR_s00238p00020510 [Amborella trichopoda]
MSMHHFSHVGQDVSHLVELSRPGASWNGADNIGAADRLLAVLELTEGLGLGTGGNGTGLECLPILVACFATEVPLVSYHRTFGRTSVPVQMIMSLYCLVSPLGAFDPTRASCL